tara:strand:- start:31 stop:303 length:273 start_codon:yes stop_codon:yes gene_type:complete
MSNKITMSKIFDKYIKGFFKFLIEWTSRNNLRRELNTMPDYLLTDIGLQRDQINGIVSGKISSSSLNQNINSVKSSRTFFNEQDDKPLAA